ncbi:hypothetical protein SLEP1_g10873 [Rubroshorea leprosula]|uniref:Uncharacterized protein n=1 Tax=Rubroshorea leprosula TaxID=152421 RepID=A0AAV5IFE3_9ROSI|nr:hypothetical protein SLEP1_g10873 [Rubroshorea leprosula]
MKATTPMFSCTLWQGVNMYLKAFGPSLRLFDGDNNQSMGFIVEELKNAKKEIQALYKNKQKGVEEIYGEKEGTWRRRDTHGSSPFVEHILLHSTATVFGATLPSFHFAVTYAAFFPFAASCAALTPQLQHSSLVLKLRIT